jgi:hypothetical protein
MSADPTSLENLFDIVTPPAVAWLRFLDRTGRTNAFTDGGGRLWPELAYEPRVAARTDVVAVEELFCVIRRWIDRHAAVAETATSGS